MLKIDQEIQQKKFASPKHKALVNLLFTYGQISTLQHRTLKPYELSVQQFNLLRILRGQFPKPSSIKLITERMIDKMSNASRLVDKLLSKELVERKSSKEDRRQVDILITEKGLKTIEAASLAMENTMNVLDITDEDAEQLSVLLDKLRD
ncbi:MarR family transcriptional regulator [Salibacteraceae bacterium]|jgi:DNA-binding MarR family transcriptional regulator|nr:MarR family transcriptional regulator [Salibacteraceae bacterium]